MATPSESVFMVKSGPILYLSPDLECVLRALRRVKISPEFFSRQGDLITRFVALGASGVRIFLRSARPQKNPPL